MSETRTLVSHDQLQEYAGRVFDLLDVRENTRAAYKKRVSTFLEFSREQNGWNSNLLLHYKRMLEARTDISISTKNSYYIPARVLLQQVSRIENVPDITQGVKGFASGKKHKREGMNDNEIQLLTKTIQALPDTPGNARLRAMISLLALQGLRQIEICRLDVSDFDLVSNTLLVQGKGADDKEPIFLQPDTVQTLKQHIEINRIASGALFTSSSNNSRAKRMTTRSLRRIVSDVLKTVGINKSVHGFRHFFTSRLIKVYKGDITQVQRYTRHRSLETLQVYNDNRTSKEDLPRFFESFSDVSFG